MKKIINLTAAMALNLAGFAFTASAHEPDETVQENVDQQAVYNHGGGLQREVYHLNKMLDHVSAEIAQYGGDRHTRSEFRHLRAEASQLNNQLRRGAQYYDRRRLRSQIEHMHAELHHLEQEMHVPTERFYQWR